MDFKDQIKKLSEKAIKLKDELKTEEATKSALILPFIQSLGYDIFNPLEIVPEFITDYGARNVEKVDYAILKENNPILIIECKHHGENLEKHYTQLHKYFHLSKARFALLTNGISYNFYTDLDVSNKMDEKPFLSFDISNIKEQTLVELKKFHNSYFDIEQILSTASELKYSNEIKLILTQEAEEPSEAFIRFFTRQVYQGNANAKVLEQFKAIINKAMVQWMSDLVNNRLKSALEKEEKDKDLSEIKESEIENGKDKTTELTEEELEAFYIVKSILRKEIPSEKIHFRDSQSYFSIFIERIGQPVLRLHFNSKRIKFITIFDKERNDNRIDIANIDEIYKYSEQLLDTARNYFAKTILQH